MADKKSNKISTGTFWYWNATPTRAGITKQLKSMADAGYSCVYIHPMPDSFHKHNFFCGMKCSYLGKKFFELVRFAFEESKKLGIRFMLYDEAGWPSGSVLETLVEKYPECRARTVTMQEDGTITEKYAAVPDQFRAEPVRRFIEMTHEAYKRELGHEFGKSIKGIFTDEPFLRLFIARPDTVVNDEIISELKKQYGKDFYKDILPHFGIFKADTPEGEEARRIYNDVCTELFAKHYSEQIAKWCDENNLELEGHFSGEDDYLSGGATGNLLRVLTPFHVPGVDVIWRQIYPGQPYGFFPRFASSVAMRMKRKETLCESFNVFTYALSPWQMNYVANALLVQGINRILPMPYMYKDTGKFKICCSTDVSPRTPTYDAMKTLNSFWEFAANYDAGALDPDVWFFTQTPLPGMEYENTERTAKQKEYNAKIISYTDALDHNAVFWRFADQDDRNSKHLPKAVIVTHPEILLDSQKEALEYWQSKGVKVVNSPFELDLKEYSEVDVAKDNICRIFPCVRPEGRALIVFNSTAEDTVFEFASDKEFTLLEHSETDSVYPLERENGVYRLPIAGHGLRILLEAPFKTADARFDKKELKLDWQIKSVEKLCFSLEGKSHFKKQQVNKVLPESGNYCEYDKDFSGRLLLESTLESEENCTAYIRFDKVNFFASLKVNGKDCGSAAFAPYIYKVELKKGKNRLQLKVSGSAGNEFRRCFREELEPAGYFNGYSVRFKKYSIDDDVCGLSGSAWLIKEK